MLHLESRLNIEVSGLNLSLMRFFFILLAILFFANSYGQKVCSKQIAGTVFDKDSNLPIPFATIQVLNSDIGTSSDEKGNFILKGICDDVVDFEVRFLGFKTVVHQHDFGDPNQVEQRHRVYLVSDQKQLESVVVEGQAVVGDLQSMTVNQIDKSRLTSKTTQSLASAIGDIQGVTFTSLGSNVQLPVIHGLYGNRVLVVNNGVKHGFQNWGTENAPEIDITSAENIAVLKGAAGVRYGPEALGGVVVLEASSLELSQKAYGGFSTGYQTNGKGYHATAHVGSGSEKFSFHVGGNYRRIGDRSTPDYLLYNTGMEEYSANIGLRYKLPQWDFKAYYSYVAQELGILRPSVARSLELFAEIVAAPEPILMRDFSYDIQEPSQSTGHHLAKIELDWLSNFGKFKLLMSQQINHRKEYDVRRNAQLPIIDLTLGTSDNRLEWYHPSIAGLEGTIGVQYFTQNNDNNPGTQSLPFIPNYNTDRFSLFAIESMQKGANTIEFGLRFDHEYNSVRGREQNQEVFRNEFTYTNLTATLGLVRNLSAKWQMRSNIGSAWRTPNMAELYSFGQHGFKIEYGLWRYESDEDGNLDTRRVLTGDDKEVKAEKSFKWTNELVYADKDHTLTLTGYVNYIDNFIFDRPAGLGFFFWGPGPTYIFDQSDALFIGGELTYQKSFTKDLKAIFGASYLWSRNVERDEPLINQPPININAEATWNTPKFLNLESSKLTLQTGYTFKQSQAPRTITSDQLLNGEEEITLQSEIFDFKDAPDGYFLAHLRWAWKFNKLGGQIEIRNMFNTPYRDYLNQMRLFADDLGRNFLITINYDF